MAKANMKVTYSEDVSRELGVRRTFVYLSVSALVVSIVALFTSKTSTYAIGDFVLLVVSLVTLIFLGNSWHRKALAALKRQHDWIALMFILVLIVQLIVAVVQVAAPGEFGYYITSLITVFLILVNKFI